MNTINVCGVNQYPAYKMPLFIVPPTQAYPQPVQYPYYPQSPPYPQSPQPYTAPITYPQSPPYPPSPQPYTAPITYPHFQTETEFYNKLNTTIDSLCSEDSEDTDYNNVSLNESIDSILSEISCPESVFTENGERIVEDLNNLLEDDNIHNSIINEENKTNDEIFFWRSML
jgi:hypothetical protein